MVAVTGRAQLQELLRAQEIQLLLLDVELDGRGWGEGIEMIHDIRNMTTIPVIIISAQDAETAKIMALNAGADDYVTVGYNPLELLARVKHSFAGIHNWSICVKVLIVFIAWMGWRSMTGTVR